MTTTQIERALSLLERIAVALERSVPAPRYEPMIPARDHFTVPATPNYYYQPWPPAIVCVDKPQSYIAHARADLGQNDTSMVGWAGSVTRG